MKTKLASSFLYYNTKIYLNLQKTRSSRNFMMFLLGCQVETEMYTVKAVLFENLTQVVSFHAANHSLAIDVIGVPGLIVALA